ncbi:putative zn 2cys6 transcription factor protein [Rosellinia necatrix]|uniref:Putative zn 2cys6 transcription factor protein n=1 Tax=Rosellinia necatrix TaxID=77044 RepID=A0A1W2TFM7_ROSNE|nr:putative zn 2cys6 transcription factor protein [Rosellinia necatrix]
MPSSSSPSPPPWRDLFLAHLATMDPPEFALGTVRHHHRHAPTGRERRPSSSAVAALPPPYAPRVRTCICRGLWAALDPDPRNDAPRNPAGVWESDLPTFTTDVRMDKVEELWESAIDLDFRTTRGNDPSSPTTLKVGEELWEEGLARMRGKGKGETVRGTGKSADERRKGSGGGAAVEALFWARQPSVQWRMRGRAYVLAPDIESSPEGREVVALLKSRMRRPRRAEDRNEKEEGEWSFAREITAHFGNLSPLMRGSFRNPPPGRPMTLSVDGGAPRLGQPLDDLEDPVARANFRVVVIVPDELDQTDLSDPERPRRWIHTYVGAGYGKGPGEWETVEVWP